MTDTTDERERQGISNLIHHEGSAELDETPEEPSIIQIVPEKKESFHRILREAEAEEKNDDF